MDLSRTQAAPIAQYAFRMSALEGEKRYTLLPDRIVVEGEPGFTAVYPLAETREIRLKYEHTKQRAYFQCFVETARGRLFLRHVHWAGMMDFEDRREHYTPFVRALLGAASAYPQIRFRAGSAANYVAAIVGIPIMGLLLVLSLALAQIIPAFVCAILLYLCIRMLGRSRPRDVDPRNPPAELLP